MTELFSVAAQYPLGAVLSLLLLAAFWLAAYSIAMLALDIGRSLWAVLRA